MCGIIGSVNVTLDPPQINKVMGHRGPDERNLFTHHNVNLYHLRLSILDVANGKQPMELGDRYVIIFNGEIYNYKDLVNKYKLSCRTNSDTEVLLHLYASQGISFLDDLDGMFALAIYDKVENKIFLTRDRAGKKPLFVYQENDQFIFSSELNAIKAHVDLKINEGAIADYLRLGSMYRTATPYCNVRELQGGELAIIDLSSLKIDYKEWWNIHTFYNKKCNDDFEISLKKVDDYLTTAIERRIESSDLEVGSFLSGGIDSGLVTAIAAQKKENLKTFTVVFDGEYNEGPLAKLVADKYKTNHTEIKISFDNLEQEVESIIYNYGEPFSDSSAIPSYYVSKEAKKHLTVILNGDGADELFAGYRRYVPFKHYDFFKLPGVTKKIAGGIKNILPPSNNKKSYYNYLYRLLDLSSKSNVDTYISATSDIFEGYNKYLLKNSFTSIQDDFDKIANSKLSGLDKIMNMDFDTILFSDLLVKMDIATMANSLEGRSPFLCKELLEYAPQLPDSSKINSFSTKHILRKLSEKYLPNEIVNQPKRGFEIPLKSWIDNELKDVIFDNINNNNSYCFNYVDSSFVKDLLADKVKISKEKRAKMLWCLFALEVWYKKSYK